MEITIYDKKGKPCAYIATDDTNTIYLLNGKPVAYIDDENIYGFNGKHLGWFKRKRVMYDREELRIGFTSISCPAHTLVEPEKSAKKVKPVKSVKAAAPEQPDFHLSKSEDKLLDFLQGEY